MNNLDLSRVMVKLGTSIVRSIAPPTHQCFLKMNSCNDCDRVLVGFFVVLLLRLVYIYKNGNDLNLHRFTIPLIPNLNGFE